MAPTPITNVDQFKKIVEGSKPVVIDFWATWCGPCKMISPVFHKLSEQFGDQIGFYSVDVDQATDVAELCGIRAMPTFIFFKDDNKIGSVQGADPAKLEAEIKKVASLA